MADFSAEYVKGRVFRFAEAACYFIDVLGECEIVLAGAGCSPGLLRRGSAIMHISAGCMMLYSCSGQPCSHNGSFYLTVRLPAFVLSVSCIAGFGTGAVPRYSVSVYALFTVMGQSLRKMWIMRISL